MPDLGRAIMRTPSTRMQNMRPELLPGIEVMKGVVADLDSKVSAAKAMTNRMCEVAGVPLAYEEVSSSQRFASDVPRADLYYGKSLTTAAREFLESRNLVGRGPALPREIYEGLVAGGVQFESDNEAERLNEVNGTLRKNSGIFHKLPNGQYGLMVWYPQAKTTKSGDELPAAAPITSGRLLQPTAPKQGMGGAKRSGRKFAHKRSGMPVGTEFDEFAVLQMGDGKGWTCTVLKQKAIEFGGVGVDESTDLRSLNVRMLGLKRAGRIVLSGKGIWALNSDGPAASEPRVAMLHSIRGAA